MAIRGATRGTTFRIWRAILAPLLGLALLAPGACAVLAQTRSLADIASDETPGRMQRLAEYLGYGIAHAITWSA